MTLDDDDDNILLNDNSNEDNSQDEETRLAIKDKLTSEDIAFVIKTMKKEAPYDMQSIKQLFYGMSTVFTKSPIPHNINSKDAGAGKSYLLVLAAGFFPKKYVIALSGMSDKAIFHRSGVMVIEKINDITGEVEVEPVDPIINDLELKIEELQEQIGEEKNKSGYDKNQVKENKQRINEIQSEIKDIRNRAEKLIDLNNQIILCLDTPQDSLFDTLMSLMSQDIPGDQKYSFAEKSTSGQIVTRVNRLRGMPVLFTTRVIDDTRALRFQEKNRRFPNVTPNTTCEKIKTANIQTEMKYGLVPEEYDHLVVSREDKQRCKHIIEIIIAKLKHHSKSLEPKELGIRMPFSIARSIPASNNQVWSMTVMERILKYLAIITKVNMDNRPKIVDNETGQFYPICTFDDLKETLQIMATAASGIRPYLTKWFNDGFTAAFKDLDDKPNDFKDNDGNVLFSERHVGLTTEQLAKKTKEVFGGSKPSSEELRYKYLYPLINQGIIDKVQSVIDGRQNIYFPVEETEGKIFSLFDDPDDLRLKVGDPSLYPSRTFIEQSFRFTLEYVRKGYGVSTKKFRLVDTDEKEITVNELIDRYFNSPEECFIKDWYPSEEQSAIIKNIQYSYIRKHVFPPPPSTRILSEIHNNITEDLDFNCHYCEFKTNIRENYEHHVVIKHPRKAGY